MKIIQRYFITLFVLAIFTLASCGGGDGPSDSNDTGLSHGSITDFGSIFVNGVEFEISGVAVTIDDNTVSESELKKGMVVTVQGSIDGSSGTATSVAVEDVVKGLVQSVAVDGLSMVVIGQTILVDNTTIIDDSIPSQDIRNLTSGVDLVEVHGFVEDKGIIRASLVELKPALVEFRVTGFVENTDTVLKTFTIGALTIDYNSADTSDLVGGNPADNQLVEVKGQNLLGPGGELIATKVEPEGLGVPDAAKVEVEGFITSLVSTSDFVVEGQQVVTTGSTIFSGGLQSELVVGLKVEVEGSLVGGVIVQGSVDAIPAPANPNLSIFGVLVDTTAILDNDFEGLNDTSIGWAAFFAAVQPNDLVKAQGDFNGTSIIWDEIEFED